MAASASRQTGVEVVGEKDGGRSIGCKKLRTGRAIMARALPAYLATFTKSPKNMIGRLT